MNSRFSQLDPEFNVKGWILEHGIKHSMPKVISAVLNEAGSEETLNPNNFFHQIGKGQSSDINLVKPAFMFLNFTTQFVNSLNALLNKPDVKWCNEDLPIKEIKLMITIFEDLFNYNSAIPIKSFLIITSHLKLIYLLKRMSLNHPLKEIYSCHEFFPTVDSNFEEAMFKKFRIQKNGRKMNLIKRHQEQVTNFIMSLLTSKNNLDLYFTHNFEKEMNTMVKSLSKHLNIVLEIMVEQQPDSTLETIAKGKIDIKSLYEIPYMILLRNIAHGVTEGALLNILNDMSPNIVRPVPSLCSIFALDEVSDLEEESQEINSPVKFVPSRSDSNSESSNEVSNDSSLSVEDQPNPNSSFSKIKSMFTSVLNTSWGYANSDVTSTK